MFAAGGGTDDVDAVVLLEEGERNRSDLAAFGANGVDKDELGVFPLAAEVALVGAEFFYQSGVVIACHGSTSSL